MRSSLLAIVLVALPACSLDWEYPPVARSGGGGAISAAGGNAAGGEGEQGGLGGSGGREATIEIISPSDGSTHGHGSMISFECVVSNADPAPEQIRWTTSAADGSTLGTGCDFDSFLPVGAQDIVVRLLGPVDAEVASDAAQVTVTP